MDDVMQVGFFHHNRRQDNVANYKPTIDELHDGFEFDVLDLDHNLVDFVFVPEIASKHTKFSIYEEWIKNNQVRVKFLDKDDMKYLGFTDEGNNEFSKLVDKGYYVHIKMVKFSDRIVLQIYTSVYKESERTIVVHSIRIKNKSELVKLLKQLVIYE